MNSSDDDETSSQDTELSWAAAGTETPEAVLASKEIASRERRDGCIA